MTDDEWEATRRAHLAFRASAGFAVKTTNRAANGSMTHGTRYAFQKRKCRCEPCMDWSREHRRRRRERQRAT